MPRNPHDRPDARTWHVHCNFLEAMSHQRSPAAASSAKPAGAWQRAVRATERVIGADVQDGEWRLVLLFFANLFLLLTAYYILKVIREPLILLGGGAVSR